MSHYPVTIELSPMVYHQLEQVAQQQRRSVAEVVSEALTAVTPNLPQPITALRTNLAQMAYLNDAALWQIARSSLTKTQRERMMALHERQQGEGVTAAERQEIEALERLYRETQLVRAHAVALLHQRQYDVADSEPFLPLDSVVI